ELTAYDQGWRDSEIGRDLKPVRNMKPLWSRYGTMIGVGLGGLDLWTNSLLNASVFGTLKHGKPDHACLKPISEVVPIKYPKPDGKITFDRLSSVYLSNTNHEEDQPVHLKVKDMVLQKTSEHDVFGGPSGCYCPAGVYEWVQDAAAGDGVRFQINAQNCVHCKTCDIKDPNQNINWETPEGPGGPNYTNL
ncbi:MAG: 4Fe-4S dicluster domain-containing protein, partial [Methylobacterium sp.]